MPQRSLEFCDRQAHPQAAAVTTAVAAAFSAPIPGASARARQEGRRISPGRGAAWLSDHSGPPRSPMDIRWTTRSDARFGRLPAAVGGRCGAETEAGKYAEMARRARALAPPLNKRHLRRLVTSSDARAAARSSYTARMGASGTATRSRRLVTRRAARCRRSVPGSRPPTRGTFLHSSWPLRRRLSGIAPGAFGASPTSKGGLGDRPRVSSWCAALSSLV